MNNDRVQSADVTSKLPKPEVKIIMDGQSIVKPGMRTFFAQDTSENGAIQSGDSTTAGVISYTVCTCNTVPVCTCDNYVKPSCSCNSHSSCYQTCSCVPVH